jgi:hypothetical protein
MMTIMMALLGANTAVTLLLDFYVPANHILSSFLFTCTGSRSILRPLHQCVRSSNKMLSLPAQVNDACRMQWYEQMQTTWYQAEHGLPAPHQLQSAMAQQTLHVLQNKCWLRDQITQKLSPLSFMRAHHQGLPPPVHIAIQKCRVTKINQEIFVALLQALSCC